DAWIEAMKPSSEAPNLKLRNKIKEKIFNIYDFNDTNVALFCDFMQFYELDSNILISKKIIERYINTKNTKMQVVLLAIITNILNFALNDNKYQSIDYFMENGEKIKNKPKI
ncbi:MAG: Rgg/GadR/MutR family transcriptional regulator, partial [Lactobacillus iners]|nr:Rgg/GadR/MutR family transcriptional regulator [Lactobacillus iners]